MCSFCAEQKQGCCKYNGYNVNNISDFPDFCDRCAADIHGIDQVDCQYSGYTHEQLAEEVAQWQKNMDKETVPKYKERIGHLIAQLKYKLEDMSYVPLIPGGYFD